MKKIIVGIAGYGMSAQYFHAPFIHANDKFNLKKIYERKSDNSKKDFPYIEVVRDFESLINDKEIDLVIISTPNSTHFNYTKDALHAGKNIIVEKPFTPTSKEADELISISQKQNKVLSVFQNRRWDSDFLTVQKLIDGNFLGKLVEYESHYDRYKIIINHGSWKEQESVSHGILFDLGTHLIDQALVLFGLPKSLWADIRIQRDGSVVEDTFEIVMYYKSETAPKATLKEAYL